ncbi:putative membrane protein YuiD [Tetrabaena socialis]|uniref:Putative membrane protein YuiD n=1 Tax=Tetrabaena socialis TaxID=47790 RepID=A0A2J7ZWQ6_9CHLO|nr:putative membrane protein YuiD [Tetrabaena socialis]|eukprot:PNH04694.1 putative membrane protein YuiD [Tetrabaena socialis]
MLIPRPQGRVWDWHRLVGSGGMPSSHTALIVALTTAVAVEHGTSSSLFAMCLVISLIVMYDATGVRLHAGRQATVLNIIIAEMPADHPVQDSERLRDGLGHTPIQVAVGALLGIVVGLLVQSLYRLGGAGREVGGVLGG